MQARPGTRGPLLDRRRERAVLDALLADLHAGHGRALMLRGEAGVGKSALLEYTVGAADGLHVVRASGVESEIDLAFSGLHLLCLPLLDRVEVLPAPQRHALEVAFGLRDGGAPDRFLVALAVLTLLSERARERPLLCVVDDTQWLDRASAQVLAFTARRLLAEPVGLLFAAREPAEHFRGLAELEVRGLGRREAHALLRSVVRFRLDEPVRDRILAETQGNPLALLELPRGLGPAQLAGGLGLVGAQTVPVRIEQGFLRRVVALPPDTRSLLFLAAAEPVGDPLLLWRAAERLGVPSSAAEAAQTEGLLHVGTRVRFRHPLVRSASYAAATPEQRRAAHRALAEVTDRERDPDRRAWHLAAATTGPDEEVAVELERSADRAQARGGMASAAAFLQRAAELTDDPARRSERALAAAQANLVAGAFGPADELVEMAAVGPLDELQQARATLLRGRIAFATSAGSEAPALLAKAAKQLEPLDDVLARETYLEAWYAGIYAGRFAGAGDLEEVSRAALAAPPPVGTPSPADVLLHGLATLVTEGPVRATPALQRSARAFAAGDVSVADRLRWSQMAVVAAGVVWDEESWTTIQDRELRLSREAGMLAPLMIWVNAAGMNAVRHGDFAAAASYVAESESIAAATGTLLGPYGAVTLAAFRGAEAEAARLVDAMVADARTTGQGTGHQYAGWVSAVLHNGLRRYDRALADAEAAAAQTEITLAMTALPEIVEAGARAGRRTSAEEALGRLAEVTGTAGTDWGLGLYARSRALLASGDDAESAYHEAVERLGRTRFRPELARAHLLYGEWLRREGRRTDARSELTTAHDLFTAIGMEAFAGRAAAELTATGESARRRSVGAPHDRLTPQEGQIARLARSGLSNPEIAAQLFLSPRTVEYHLAKVFATLGISSRRELRAVLPDVVSPAPAD